MKYDPQTGQSIADVGQCKPYTGHGVSTVIRQFANELEMKYGYTFSESEAMTIFVEKKFVFQGEEDPSIPELIAKHKSNFVSILMNSVLVADKKVLSTSTTVLFSGGGTYLLAGVQFPKHVVLDPLKEYGNVNGYNVVAGWSK